MKHDDSEEIDKLEEQELIANMLCGAKSREEKHES